MASVAGVHVRPEVDAERPPQDHADAVGRSDPDRPETDAHDEGDAEGKDGRDRDDARAPTEVAGDADRSDLVGQDPG